jgi:hypothetical protein
MDVGRSAQHIELRLMRVVFPQPAESPPAVLHRAFRVIKQQATFCAEAVQLRRQVFVLVKLEDFVKAFLRAVIIFPIEQNISFLHQNLGALRIVRRQLFAFRETAKRVIVIFRINGVARLLQPVCVQVSFDAVGIAGISVSPISPELPVSSCFVPLCSSNDASSETACSTSACFA